MKTFRTVLPALVGMLGLGLPSFGQSRDAAPDGGLVSAAVATAQKQYNDSFVGPPQLYNGPEYVDYAKRYHARTGHQFFLSPERQRGSIYYNDHYFSNIRLSYDVVLDQIVLQQPTSPLSLRLVNEQVRYFFIDGHHFVRLLADSSAGDAIRTGYYEVLADGRVQVLARRSKQLQERINQTFIDVEFPVKDRLFIKKAGVYYPITRKSAVVRLFADHKKEVQQFLQEKKLRFNKDQFEPSVVQLAQYYAGLP